MAIVAEAGGHVTTLTTADKIRSLIKGPAIVRIEQAGLKIVDRADFDTMIQQNNELATENKSLRLKVRELEAQLGRQTKLL